MTLKKVYFGSVGPFLYDDADDINDPDGDFSGETQQGVTTDGKFRQKESAITDDDCVRKGDLTSSFNNLKIGDLSNVNTSGLAEGDFIIYNAGTTNFEAVSFVEEGDWTPEFEGGSTVGSLTYSIQSGRFLRHGNLVTVVWRIDIDAISIQPTGSLSIKGLPYSTGYSVPGVSLGRLTVSSLPTDFVQFTGYVGSNEINIMYVRDNGSDRSFPADNIDSSTSCFGSVTFIK